jgi:hypothetical protein
MAMTGPPAAGLPPTISSATGLCWFKNPLRRLTLGKRLLRPLRRQRPLAEPPERAARSGVLNAPRISANGGARETDFEGAGPGLDRQEGSQLHPPRRRAGKGSGAVEVAQVAPGDARDERIPIRLGEHLSFRPLPRFRTWPEHRML